MTTLALVQGETRRTGSRRLDCLTTVPRFNNNVAENELTKRDVTTQQIRKSRKHAVQEFDGDNKKIRYTSQIGLIYLKPMAGYTVSVSFHSKNDCNEKHRHSTEDRYALT